MISLSQETDTVFFKFKLTPGATHSFSRFSDSKTMGDSLERESVHTWLWLCGQWNNRVAQSAPVPETLLVISNSISLFQMNALFFPSTWWFRILFPFSTVGMDFWSFVSSCFYFWPREYQKKKGGGGEGMHHLKILMWTFKKLRISRFQIDRKGEEQRSMKLLKVELLCLFQTLCSLAGRDFSMWS